jgi:cytochrome o ubiquinol oxidase subunit 1
VAYSVWKRQALRDTTGDPWDGRTLEWSVPSPAPHYNFAVQPVVTRRDEWWYKKQEGRTGLSRTDFVDIWLPKNSSVGVIVGVLAGLFGFGVIWHLWWLVGIGVTMIIIVVVMRTLNDDSEHHVSSNELFHESAKAAR